MDKFVCPLTLERMTEPVTTLAGHTYERAAIERHFETQPNPVRDPLSNTPIARILIPNIRLRQLIEDEFPGTTRGTVGAWRAPGGVVPPEEPVECDGLGYRMDLWRVRKDRVLRRHMHEIRYMCAARGLDTRGIRRTLWRRLEGYRSDHRRAARRIT